MGCFGIRCMERTAAHAEKFLNPIDKVPFISSYSGVARILAAEVQIVAGIAFAALKIFMALLEGRWHHLYEAKQGLALCLHGILNIIRGAIAIFPFIGNAALIFWDYQVGRMEYRSEQVPHSVYPIIRNFVPPQFDEAGALLN